MACVFIVALIIRSRRVLCAGASSCPISPTTDRSVETSPTMAGSDGLLVIRKVVALLKPQGDNLGMWAKAQFTTPSALMLDPRARWEPVDAHTARLLFLFGEEEQSLRVAFDPETGLIMRMSGMRHQNQE